MAHGYFFFSFPVPLQTKNAFWLRRTTKIDAYSGRCMNAYGEEHLTKTEPVQPMTWCMEMLSARGVKARMDSIFPKLILT